MKTIAVTGSSGFIGKHLVKALNEKVYKVIPLDYDDGYDLLKSEDVARIPSFDIIVHLAAKSFVPQSFEKPYGFYNHNCVTTLNILETARAFNAKVISFSSYLYGQPDYLPIDENHPVKPHNPYAQTKLIGEKMCEGYSRDFNVPIIIFRPFNIYGEGQNTSFLIPMMIGQMKTGVISLKDPRPKRDFIYISDVVHAVLLAIELETSQLEVFNLGFGKSHSIAQVIEMIKQVSKISFQVNFSNEIRQGEVLDTIADTSKLFNSFNWRPKVSLSEGIRRMLNQVL
jgi:UDP-glucose 4-epimerase